MIDHVLITVKDFEKSKSFYEKSLLPLGYKIIDEEKDQKLVGFGKADDFHASFWIKLGKPFTSSVHVAFKALYRKNVDAFYKAAIHSGGKHKGKPHLRPEYHANYYGAFVYDPDGNNIEAVCHNPE